MPKLQKMTDGMTDCRTDDKIAEHETFISTSFNGESIQFTKLVYVGFCALESFNFLI